MIKLSSVLQEARSIISKRENWTKEALAKTSSGKHTAPQSPYAVCWCVAGAVAKAARLDLFNEVASLLAVAASLQDFQIISDFNDDPETSHADVLALLDKAIAKQLEKEAQ